MRVLFAPDYRVGVPYQVLLADGLSKRGVQVSFLSNYHRGFVLPWHFHGGIIMREADFLARGGKIVFPLSELEVVSK